MLKLYLISSSIFLLDILTKNYIQNKIMYGDQVEITSFLSFVHFQNPGAAFSFLSDQGGWQRYFLIVISLLAVIYIPWLINQYKKNMLIVIGLLLILGGAIGNLYDRISYGYVIDFIYFHIAEFYWPAFNVADSAISIGVLLFLYGSFRSYKKI
ncbi:MAG: signal peptidase II [Burkholderiales bacterium]|jgi:signal peptidase II|tara:strand:- start:938 stop:1399 length:462 start_codon:yes stop_codon:yes gene_type:complete